MDLLQSRCAPWQYAGHAVCGPLYCFYPDIDQFRVQYGMRRSVFSHVPIAMAIPGVNAMALGLCIMAASNYGQATPAACPVTGMVASTKWVTPKYLMKYGWFISTAALIAIVCVAYPVWSIIFPA